jgi:hypothetical protein
MVSRPYTRPAAARPAALAEAARTAAADVSHHHTRGRATVARGPGAEGAKEVRFVELLTIAGLDEVVM